MIPPPGYNLAEMTAIAEELNQYFVPYLDDEPEQFAGGKTAVPALEIFLVLTDPQRIRVIAETKDPNQIDAFMQIINERFRTYPGMRAFSQRGSIITSNDGGTRSVNVDVSGTELESIYEAAMAVYRKAAEVFEGGQINSVPSSLTLGQPLIEIRPRWERAAELGFSAQELGYAVAALSDGAYVDEFYLDGDDKIDMFLYSSEGTRQTLGNLGSLPIHTPSGSVVPLSSIADLVETVATDSIRRVDGRRTVTLNIIASRAVALETAVARVKEDVIGELAREGQVPAGVTLDISGASDQLDATREALSGNFAIALMLCYLLLVAIFTHWGYPLVIMTTVPLGIAGGIIGLWILNGIGAGLPMVGLSGFPHQPFDMITMMGFLILLGTVVNNPILIVDEMRYRMREGELDPKTAVREAVDARLRPVLMSTITTLFGLAPLVFLPGAGTELYRGLGAIVLFGLLFAMLVTLVFLPPLLVTLMDIRRGIGGLLGLRVGDEAPRLSPNVHAARPAARSTSTQPVEPR
jgi:multidrug efflux pump subunit AcrB